MIPQKDQQAGELFSEGFSCSQAVFTAFSEELGLDRKTALKLSQAMGGGMAHMGLTCGAVTGAFLAIGLKHGRIRAEDMESREKTYALVKEFVERFTEKFGTISCRELIHIDLDNPVEFQKAKDDNLFEKVCLDLVRTSARIVEDLLG